MKKKKSKLIGVVLIIAAILLQVGYAATEAVAGVTRTRDFEVQIESKVGEETSDYVVVELASDTIKNGLVRVNVNNLYPGAYFTVLSRITNLGKEIRLKSVKIKPTSEGNKELYDNLVFYDEDNKEMKQDDYKAYLTKKHKDMKLALNETIDFKLKIGLSSEVTELEDTTTNFLVEIIYDQDEPKIDDPDPKDPDPKDPDPKDPNPKDPNPNNLEKIIDEPIPGGSAMTEIVDETIPDRPVITEIVDEDMPEGPVRLPKTGGMGALLVYALGLTLLGGGIGLYRKGKKDE